MSGTDEELREDIETRLHETFRPEFLNRIDEVLIFERLGTEALTQILEIQLAQLRALLEARDLELDVSDAAKSRLVELGYEPAFGARPLKRVLVRELQDPLAEALLRGEFTPGGDRRSGRKRLRADPLPGVNEIGAATRKARPRVCSGP